MHFYSHFELQRWGGGTAPETRAALLSSHSVDFLLEPQHSDLARQTQKIFKKKKIKCWDESLLQSAEQGVRKIERGGGREGGKTEGWRRRGSE